MAWLSLCALGILASFLLKICEELFPKFKPAVLAAVGILFFLLFFKWCAPLLQKLSLLGEESTVPALFKLLYKGLGLAFLVSIAASFCRDLGEEKVAEKLELCGKGAILYLSLPVLETVLSWLGEILS